MKEKRQKNCPRIGDCPMFELFKVETALETFQKLYCKSKYESCQRKILFDKGKEISKNLLPNGKHL